MSWFEQLKMIPMDSFSLGYVIVNAAETEKTIQELKNLTYPPNELKKLLLTAEKGQINLQKLKDAWGQPPHGDQTLEQMEQNIQKIKEAINLLTPDDVRELLREAMEAKRNSNQAKVDEILENIEQNADLSTTTLKKYRDIRDMLDILREKSGKSSIMFENPPSDTKLLADFAEAIGGELKEGSILTDLKDNGELVALMVPKRSKTTKEIIDNDNILAQKDKVKETYNKIMRNPDGSKTNTKMLFVSGSETVEVDDLVRQKKILVASEEKMEVIEPFSEVSVLKYVSAVNKIKGSISAFKPKTFSNGSFVPQVIFLEKSSSNNMNLNPYTKLLLKSNFQGENWFKVFFDTLRSTEMLSEEQAEQILIEEIYQTMINEKSKTPSGILVNTFIGEAGIPDYKSKTGKEVRKEIRRIIKESDRLEELISNKIFDKQKEQLEYLSNNFTLKEAAEFEKFYQKLSEDDPEEFPPDAIEIEYFKDGFPTKENVQVMEGNKPKLDESGAAIFQTVEGKESANYAKVKYQGESITPQEAYDIGLTVSERETENVSEIKRQKIKNIQEKIERANSRLKEMKNEESRSRQKEKIQRLEEELKEANELRQRTLTNIGEQTLKLRNQMLNPKNFNEFILSTSIKLVDEGGLIGLVSEVQNSAAVLEQITAERSLGFFAQMDEHAGKDEVRKAFKTIDSDPYSDEAVNTAKELNDKMIEIISNITKELVWAFKNKLEDFTKNYSKYPDNKVIPAKTQFMKKGLIRLERGEIDD